jgi:predicted phosphohydrolase
MTIFALGDPHLGQAVQKPMDIFGPRWERHTERMEANWRATVGDDDWVLLPGDISWAMRLEDALVDLRLIDSRPGRKVLLKGHHDYWWTSRAKVEAVLPPSLRLLQHDAVDLGGGLGLVGTRGWTPPGAPRATERDEKIYRREVQRLELSLRAAQGRFERLVAMLHYPPVYVGLGETDFVAPMRDAGVEVCVYGHLHAGDHRYAFEGERDGIRYEFVAADAIEFTPRKIRLRGEG